MVSYLPAEFGSHRHCCTGDVMFLVVAGQDSTCPGFYLPLMFISKVHGMAWSTHQISGHRHNNYPLCPMKDS